MFSSQQISRQDACLRCQCVVTYLHHHVVTFLTPHVLAFPCALHLPWSLYSLQFSVIDLFDMFSVGYEIPRSMGFSGEWRWIKKCLLRKTITTQVSHWAKVISLNHCQHKRRQENLLLSATVLVTLLAVTKHYEHKQLMDELIWAHSSGRKVRDGGEDMTTGSWMWKLREHIFKSTQEAEKMKWKWDEVIYVQKPPPGMHFLRRESQRRKRGLSGRTTPACLFDITASFSFIK